MVLRIDVKQFAGEAGTAGKALGFGVHADETVKALKRYGVTIDPEARITLHIGPAHMMDAVPGKRNILYTAWEAPDLPPEYIEKASRMDLIIGVSDFVAKAFRRGIPSVRSTTCHLGVNVNLFQYRKRTAMPPFIYLWVGAPNERKGWQLIQMAWKSFSHLTDCVLVIKTTRADGPNDIQADGNVMFDSRKITTAELAEVYRAAHCFLFPSFGEGFGLPLAEAMATGLPCIFTPWGGVTDFADKDTGFPVSYETVGIDYGVKSTGAMAKMDDLIKKMVWVKDNYRQAVVKGKEARRRIENNFTWDDTGRNLKKILEDFSRWPL